MIRQRSYRYGRRSDSVRIRGMALLLYPLDHLGAGSQIYISGDSGATWTAREGVRNWVAITMSADGAKLAAAVLGDTLFVSSDSGVTWGGTQSSRSWTGIASSSDGTKLAAVAASNQIQIYA